MKLGNLDRPLMVVVSFNIYRVLWNNCVDILDPTTGGGGNTSSVYFYQCFYQIGS